MRIREISNAKRGPCFGCKWIAYCLIEIISIVQKFSNQQTRYERLDRLNQQQCADLEILLHWRLQSSNSVLFTVLSSSLQLLQLTQVNKKTVLSVFLTKHKEKPLRLYFRFSCMIEAIFYHERCKHKLQYLLWKNTIFVTKMRRHKKGWIAFIEYRKRNQLNCVKDVPVQ